MGQLLIKPIVIVIQDFFGMSHFKFVKKRPHHSLLIFHADSFWLFVIYSLINEWSLLQYLTQHHNCYNICYIREISLLKTICIHSFRHICQYGTLIREKFPVRVVAWNIGLGRQKTFHGLMTLVRNRRVVSTQYFNFCGGTHGL